MMMVNIQSDRVRSACAKVSPAAPVWTAAALRAPRPVPASTDRPRSPAPYGAKPNAAGSPRSTAKASATLRITERPAIHRLVTRQPEPITRAEKTGTRANCPRQLPASAKPIANPLRRSNQLPMIEPKMGTVMPPSPAALITP